MLFRSCCVEEGSIIGPNAGRTDALQTRSHSQNRPCFCLCEMRPQHARMPYLIYSFSPNRRAANGIFGRRGAHLCAYGP